MCEPRNNSIPSFSRANPLPVNNHWPLRATECLPSLKGTERERIVPSLKSAPTWSSETLKSATQNLSGPLAAVLEVQSTTPSSSGGALSSCLNFSAFCLPSPFLPSSKSSDRDDEFSGEDHIRDVCFELVLLRPSLDRSTIVAPNFPASSSLSSWFLTGRRQATPSHQPLGHILTRAFPDISKTTFL